MSSKLEKAQLRELDANSAPANKKRSSDVTVQFNPETLKVSYTNRLVSADTTSQPLEGNAKLSVQLWFDVSSETETDCNDVRDLTRKVVYFITPQDGDAGQVTPILRFIWGSFQFDGVVESIEESLEFFSPEGRPLRANVSLSVTKGTVEKFELPPLTPELPGPGTAPLTPAPPGHSLQQLVANSGGGRNWQPVATANGIENPRFPLLGQQLDLNRPRRP